VIEIINNKFITVAFNLAFYIIAVFFILGDSPMSEFYTELTVFRNVGTQNLGAVESPKRKNTILQIYYDNYYSGHRIKNDVRINTCVMLLYITGTMHRLKLTYKICVVVFV